MVGVFWIRWCRWLEFFGLHGVGDLFSRLAGVGDWVF